MRETHARANFRGAEGSRVPECSVINSLLREEWRVESNSGQDKSEAERRRWRLELADDGNRGGVLIARGIDAIWANRQAARVVLGSDPSCT